MGSIPSKLGFGFTEEEKEILNRGTPFEKERRRTEAKSLANGYMATSMGTFGGSGGKFKPPRKV